MTELIWQGKYDEQGRRVAPLRVALPFQTVETVNESAQDRLRTRDLFAAGRDTEWRNRLIWGELAALDVEAEVKKRTVSLRLKDFIIPPDDVPEDVRRAVTKWEQWVDYWTVDWDYHGDTFHNQWQDYRTRKKRDLLKEVKHEYPQPGEYTVMVKVIDILGNGTTKTVNVTA